MGKDNLTFIFRLPQVGMMRNIELLLEQYHIPQMRLAVRSVRNHVIQESKKPQTGAYWWLPTPDGDWELDIYYDDEFGGNTQHIDMWPKYVVDRLAVLWNKDPHKLRRQIKNNYTGLPRGRVGRAMGKYVVSHGEDVPVRNGMKKVVNAFNLSSLMRDGKVHVSPDIHENMTAGDPEAVQRALGVDLGLQGISTDDLFDWDD